jgi:ribonuclease P protein component
MLKKDFRVTKERDFKRIYQKGKFFSNGEFTIRFLPNRFSFPRFAVVILKKHIKKAVKRNKFRRQLQEIVRLSFEKVRPGFDIVVLSRKDLTVFKYEDLEKSLLGLLEKGNLLKK